VRDLHFGQLERTLRFFRWRTAALLFVFGCGLAAFEMGVEVSDRPGIPEGNLLTQSYYAIGLFVLGGLDLGVPVGGPELAQDLLWFTYFAAPTITASALVEGILRIVRPRGWAIRRMRGHVVIGGCGRLAMQYLKRLREHQPRKPVVMVDARPDAAGLEEARELYGAHIVVGDVGSDVLLGALRLSRADRILMLTGNDFTNLDTAAKILQSEPEVAGRIVAHVSDIAFLRIVAETHVADDVTIFNTHQIAAQHLVETKLLKHFQRTEPLDTVVIAGFGRFGQTVLDELQTRALDSLDHVILIDVDCVQRSMVFDEQVGFDDAYKRDVLEGDLRDPRIWRDLDLGEEPVLIIGSGDDGVNLRTALWLKARYPEAYVLARSFRHSAFGTEVSELGGLEVVSVADLIEESFPAAWLS
jgi:Trk K+ transport system NAD-binding subunit